MSVCSESTAVGDDAVLSGGTSGGGTDGLKSAEDVVGIVRDLAEDDVLAVEMGGGSEAEEELGAVGVWAGVGHGEDTSASVSVGEVLIVELAAVDGLATSSVTSGEVAALGHEAWDDTVELGSLEVEVLALSTHASLAGAESAEVLSGLRGVLGVKGDGDSSSGLATDGHVEED